MRILRSAPSPDLAGLVQGYESRSTEPCEGVRRLPLIARTSLTLDFYLAAATELEDQHTGRVLLPTRAVLVAPQTARRFDVLLGPGLDMFCVHLQPTAIHAITGVPMWELVNGSVDAQDLLGPRFVEDMADRLAEARGFGARVQVAQAFLRELLGAMDPQPQQRIHAALNAMLACGGNARVEDLARAAAFSERNFARHFREQVGMSPKLYARIVRLQSALALKAAGPEGAWAAVAQAAGYFDQAHLIRDCRQFTGMAPVDLAQAMGAGTPRQVG